MSGLNKASIEILELTNDTIKFILNGVDTSVANSLRRAMIAEVPTMAFDFVDIKKNDSVLHDEFLAHRLGLIPLRSWNVDKFNMPRDCSCDDNCPDCGVLFSLNVRCTAEWQNVYSSDIKNNAKTFEPGFEIQPLGVTEHKEDDGGRERTREVTKDDRVLIVKLGKNQSISCDLVARKGIAKEHAKWQPVSISTFAYEADIQLDNAKLDELTDGQKQEFVAACPAKVFDFDEHSGTVTAERPRDCVYCDECYLKAEEFEKLDLVSIKQIPNRFIFTVETTGALKPEMVVVEGLRVLRGKINTLQKELPSGQEDLADSDSDQEADRYTEF